MGRVITALKLRPGLEGGIAFALFLGLSSAQVYRELIKAAGWSPGRYESWLLDTLAQQLLAARI